MKKLFGKNIITVLSWYYFPADMSVVSDIDIKDEPLFPSSDDNEVGYAWFIFNLCIVYNSFIFQFPIVL